MERADKVASKRYMPRRKDIRMRAAICDDQPQALEELKKVLLRIPAVKKVHTYSDMNKFWATLKDGAYYDVVFMAVSYTHLV